MEKMPPFTGGYCYFAQPWFFFQPGEILRCKRARIDVGKRRALKVRFQRPGDRAVKNGLAADAISTDRRAVFRRLGRIQLVTANAGDCRNADVPLHAGGHRPQDIVAVKDVDIFINQNNIF